jgi:hypothetical protein
MLLTKASSAVVETDPFPHLIIDEALPPAAYQALVEHMPSDDYLCASQSRGPNRYHRRSSREILKASDALVHPVWKRFVRQHLAADFFESACHAFNGHLLETDRRLMERAGRRLSEMKPLQRGQRSLFRKSRTWLECQISLVTPTERYASPLGPHLDRENTVWAGLYYLGNHPSEIGGDLLFYRFKHPARREYWRDRMIPPSLVEIVKVVEARENRLVMFLHGPDAVHGVSPREPNRASRKAVNLVCEFPFKVWDVSQWSRNIDRFPADKD